MVKENTEQSTQAETKLLHVQIIDGSSADVFEIGQALKRFTDAAGLPYKLQFIISDDKVQLRDVDTLIQQLMELKQQIKQDERLS